uniref:Uncharacterized protein n=1 Tax=Rhizophora mucronata TaxID=61149 RepID=A0A2P2N7G4_RHIMU
MYVCMNGCMCEREIERGICLIIQMIS